MRSTFVAAALSASLALAPPGAAALEAAGGGEAPFRLPFPTELVERPLTLPRGTAEIVLPIDLSLSSDRVASPITFAPSAHYGLTDGLTAGVRHFRGLCVTGTANGCPHVYEDVGVDVLGRLWRGGGVEVAAGASLDAAPIDPFTLSLGLRVVARWTGGPFAFALAPSLSVGLDDRDGAQVKALPIELPLATYAFGWVQEVTGNREFLTVPATIQVQVFPPLALAAGGALVAPIDPREGTLADYATFPVGAAVIVTPSTFDVGAAFTFGNLLGRERWPQSQVGAERSARIFLALRL